MFENTKQRLTVPASALLALAGFIANDRLLIMTTDNPELTSISRALINTAGYITGLLAILLAVFAISEFVCLAASSRLYPGKESPVIFTATRHVLILATGALLVALADSIATFTLISRALTAAGLIMAVYAAVKLMIAFNIFIDSQQKIEEQK